MLDWLLGRKENEDQIILPLLETLVENIKKAGVKGSFQIVPSDNTVGCYDITYLCMETYVTVIKVTALGKSDYKLKTFFEKSDATKVHYLLHNAIITFGASMLLEKNNEQQYFIHIPPKKRLGHAEDFKELPKKEQKEETKEVQPEEKKKEAGKKEQKHPEGVKDREELLPDEIKKEDIPTLALADVGGLVHIKKELQYIVWGLTHNGELQQEGCSLPHGVLLYGPPGCGKTYLARALAGETKSLFRILYAEDFWSKWHMEGPRKLKDFFATCKAKRDNLIIYIDEIDVLAGPRTEAITAADKDENRLVSVLLTEMDGIDKKKNIIIIGSTNLYNPEKKMYGLDAALLRPGRFDKILYIPPPDATARKEILAIHCKKKEEAAGKTLFCNLNFDMLIEKTEGKTGADLESLLAEALQKRIEKKIESGQDQPLLSEQDILDVLATMESRDRRMNKIGF